MAASTLSQSITDINLSLDKIIQQVKELEAETIQRKPSEEEWSIMQILCHIVEAVPYWLTEIETLLATPGVEWGRGLQDQARLAAVTNIENESVSNVLTEIVNLKEQVEKTLSKLNVEMLKQEAPSRNPRFGVKPLTFIVDHLLVEHVEKHYSQIQRNLTKFGLIK
ncbi:DinB family protein [Neobacillus sp. 3P2-tot-E-2]|uniref:DinB family protein n=1 Tax=Neobacillus sp. 3P2-tot-E-2 TaxID=3132212 RepID=UPI0039A39130